MRRGHVRAGWFDAVIVVSLVLAEGPARADDAVTFEEALAAAPHSPDVVGLSEARRVREPLERGISGAPENPDVELRPGVRVAPSGERGLELQASVTQALSLADLGGARRGAARSEREALAAREAAARLERQLGAAEAWLDVWASAAELTLVREERTRADELVVAVERARVSGERTQTDVATFRAYAAEVELRAIAIEGRLHHEGLWLATEMGSEAGAPVAARGDPPTVSLPDDVEISRLVRNVEHMPEVVHARLLAAATRAHEAEARAEAASRVFVGAAAQIDQPSYGVAAFAVVGARPAILTMDERRRASLLGEAARLEGDHARLIRDSRRAAADAVHELDHSRETEAALAERLVPALDEVARLEERALSAGESTVQRVVEARRRALEARQRLAQAVGERRWAQVKVWLMLAQLRRGERP